MFEDRIPPQCVPVEEAVLGAIIVEGRTAQKAISILTEKAFYKTEHQKIFIAIKTLSYLNKPIDLLTVCAELKSSGDLELCGGEYGIIQLAKKVNTGDNIETHCLIILDNYIRRKVIENSLLMVKKGHEEDIDSFELVNEFQKSAQDIILLMNFKGSSNFSDCVNVAVKNIKTLAQSGTSILGIPTGIAKQDEMTSGRCAGELVIIASRPGMGKTSFMIQEIINVSRLSIPIGIFSLEMTSGEIINRIISNIANVPLWKLRRPSYLNGDDFDKIEAAKEVVSSWKLLLNDSGSISINEIITLAGLWVQESGIKALYIDYLQLIKGIKEKNGNRQQEIGSISRGLKALAKQYQIPVIALAQIGRSAERSANKKPSLADLREAGDIENDADIVEFLYRAEYYNFKEDDNGSTEGKAEIIFGKNRHGMTGDFVIEFEKDFCRFTDKKEILETETFKNNGSVEVLPF